MVSNDKKPSTWQFISPSNQTSSLFPLMTIRTGLSEHPLPLTKKSSWENQTSENEKCLLPRKPEHEEHSTWRGAGTTHNCVCNKFIIEGNHGWKTVLALEYAFAVEVITLQERLHYLTQVMQSSENARPHRSVVVLH